MEKIINELREIVSLYSGKLSQISENEFSAKPLPHKWSKKEVIGHLIDSAQNNLRRFVTGQYEANPPKITYDQDRWVASADYQHRKSEDVIVLWKLINDQVCAVLKTMSPSVYARECDTGKQAIQLHSLEWLADDYVKHLKHHLNQIIPGSFNIRYS